jgi:signal transduction histidine kinase/ActR/RegA family two-component response regulator
MLSLGFLLWGLYLASYPVSREYENLFNAGFFVAAVLQLFIAVSMIVLVLEEVRYKTEKVLAEIAEVRSEKEALQLKVISTEEQVRNLYDQVRLTNSAQQAYAELRRTQQVVVQQERLRALGQMASGIAHDINNALSPIVAYSDLLIGTLPNLAETSRRQLGHIQKAAQDITKIVERMREFYRKRSATEQLSEVNVNQVVEDAVELTRPRWRDLPQRQGISIHILRELEPNLPLLLSDPGELREALINLIFNAVDALPHGGTITFVTRSSSGPASEPSGVPGRRIQIEVRDNGIGMDEKTRRHCLEPFFSTKAQRGGTGLGLAMVYGIMQRHEGTIDIDSTLGRGTCIRLTFPILEKTPQPVTITASPDEQKRSLRVLCIDDEPMVRQLLVDCLKRYNHKVSVASSGRHGLEMFHSAIQNKKPYDAVITDLGMPEVDGHQVARAVKAKSPDTPVIMMTGWGSVMKDDGETTPHVDALVGKPPSMEELNKLLLHITATKKHTIAQGAEVSLAPTLP